MFKIFWKLFILFCVFQVIKCEIHTEKVSYKGYKVLRIQTRTRDQAEKISKLENEDIYDIWRHPYIGGHADIMTSSDHSTKLETFLNENNYNYTTIIENVESLIASEKIANQKFQYGRMNWDAFQRYEEIDWWMYENFLKYPHVTKYNTGTSLLGRMISMLKIHKENPIPKLSVYMDGGLHGREWISVSTVTYIMNEFLENQEKYAVYLDNFDLYFKPIPNPDGYVYSHDTDRLFRKNYHIYDPNFQCIGVDINRNFDFQFGGNGSSDEFCSKNFRGPYEFSEKESHAIRNDFNYFEAQFGADWQAYISMHSYGQLWLTPWGYTTELPEDYDELKLVGELATEALRTVRGTEYTVGSTANLLYPNSGNSVDWAYNRKIKYSYNVELPDTGNYGFLMPHDQIKPVGEETFEAFKAVLDYLLLKNNRTLP